uniref:Protein kinase domain-containing protein n=2 Tax=Heterosigma akashiwo TaxID=2829 RepID=A0A6V1PE54_HETAK
MNHVLESNVNFTSNYKRAIASRHIEGQQTLNIIDPNDIKLNNIIGEGSFGRVWAGVWRASKVAVKEFVFAQEALRGGALQRNELVQEIVGEAAIMSFLRHPKVLHLYGCSITSQSLWIVSELCSRGSLRQVLNDRRTRLSTRRRLQLAIDVAEGMLYLHNHEAPIVHRDLKSHNIFIHEKSPHELEAKIGDWGSARAVALSGQRTMTHGVGTACWIAPEVIRYARYTQESDVYAFGILLWELATREEVYAGFSAAQIIARVANDHLRPVLPRGCPWNDIMALCWAEDPSSRPKFEHIMEWLMNLLAKNKR